MILRVINRERLMLAAALAVWVGVWGSWITHIATGLSQNAFYLAEWSTYLLDVRYGGMRLAPELIRLSIALGSAAGCMTLTIIGDWRMRWTARLLVIPIGLNLLPPYPDILNLWWSEGYGVRFVVAVLFWLGFVGCVAYDRLSQRVRSATIILLSFGSAVGGVLGFAQLSGPFGAHYASAILPGWGLALYGIGLTTVTITQVWEQTRLARGNQKGPDVI